VFSVLTFDSSFDVVGTVAGCEATAEVKLVSYVKTEEDGVALMNAMSFDMILVERMIRFSRFLVYIKEAMDGARRLRHQSADSNYRSSRVRRTFFTEKIKMYSSRSIWVI